MTGIARWTALWLAAATAAEAIQFENSTAYSLAEGSAQKDELWLFTGKADISGTAEDDVFLVAQSGRFGGVFKNDLWATAEEIDFSGTADEHVRVAGNTIRVGGTVGKSLIAAGNSITIGSQAMVQDDAVVFGQNVLVEGRIGGGMRVFGQSVTIHGSIGGNLRIIADDIVVAPGSEIGGDLVWTSSQKLILDDRVKLGGKLVEKGFTPDEAPRTRTSLLNMITGQTFLYLCMLLAALPFVGLFPRYVGSAVRTLRGSPWKCALVGLLSFCLMPMLALLALVTVIGIPFSLILIALFAVLVYLSKIIVALVVGGILFRRRGPQPFASVFTALVAGLILLYAAGAFPYTASAVWLLSTFMGLGAMVLALIGSQVQYVAPPSTPTSALPDSTNPDASSEQKTGNEKE